MQYGADGRKESILNSLIKALCRANPLSSRRAASEPARHAFSGAAFFADPYAVYAAIRALPEPLFDPGTRSWLICRFADVETLLLHERGLSKTVRGPPENMESAEPSPFDTAVLFRDPPGHARSRMLINQAFSCGAMDGLAQRVCRIADRIIDEIAAKGGCDFMTAFALPLPVTVIIEIMGIPQDDKPRLQAWSSAFIVDRSIPKEDSDSLQQAAIGGMTDYFEKLIADRGSRGGDGLIGDLIRARHDGGRLSPEELVGNCMLLLIAGHETTVNLLGNGLHLLLQDRGRFEEVRAKPEILSLGVEEMLRYESPVQLGTFRVATESIEVAGRKIEAGSAVTLVLGSANRDPLRFPGADRFELTRSPNRHLGFGLGPHRCVGTGLARMEARIGFSRLVERLPDLRLDAPTRPMEWRHNAVTRGLKELWVRC
jgi:cytochrome P450